MDKEEMERRIMEQDTQIVGLLNSGWMPRYWTYIPSRLPLVASWICSTMRG